MRLNCTVKHTSVLYNAIKMCYPKSQINIIRSFEVDIMNIDDEKISYKLWIMSQTKFSIKPMKFLPNQQMKEKAQEIALRIKDFIENGNSIQNVGSEIPSVCPSCRNPNTNKLSICEWCGYQII
jgi:hypothetical protein